MKNTTWRKKRMKKGLTISEVANYLEMDYKKYEVIDRGIVKMPNRFIERFNELINKSKGETSINRLTREEVVNEWWDTMSQKIGHGQFKLNEKMIDFNIRTLNELDLLLGYKNKSGTMSNYLNGHQHVGFDVKNKVYSFFENELNIQAPKVKQEKVTKCRETIQNSTEYKELLKWYDNFDLKDWRDKHPITNNDLSEKSGLATGTIYNIIRKTHSKPTITVMKRLKDFVENYTEEKPVNGPMGQLMTFTHVPTEDVPEDIRLIGARIIEESETNMLLKDKLLTKYEQEVERLSGIIEEHKSLIADLKREKDFYEKIINDINED